MVPLMHWYVIHNQKNRFLLALIKAGTRRMRASKRLIGPLLEGEADEVDDIGESLCFGKAFSRVAFEVLYSGVSLVRKEEFYNLFTVEQGGHHQRGLARMVLVVNIAPGVFQQPFGRMHMALIGNAHVAVAAALIGGASVCACL